MDRGQLSSRIAALRAECAALGRELVQGGRDLDVVEAFEVAGELQGLVTAAEGAQGVAAAYGARVETRLCEQGPVERTHPVGFVDPMAPSMLALEAGLTEGLAGRKVALGAGLGQRFPLVRDRVVAGDVPTSSAQKVLDACAGLDLAACGRVDAEVAGRLAGLDPAGVTAHCRRVAARVAADQVAAQAERTRRCRTVEVRPSQDGLTDWYALLPTAASAAAWSAVEALANEYRAVDGDLTLAEARADAFQDLLLRNVTVSAQVTLGVPVLTGDDCPLPGYGPGRRVRVDLAEDETVVDDITGALVRIGDLTPDAREALSWVEIPALEDPAGGAPVEVPVDPRLSRRAQVGGLAVSGTHLPGLGWVDAATIAGLLQALPLEVARAVLDAETGTLASLTSAAYRPPKAVRELVTTRDGTCRMWGCSRRAEHTDLDHTRPWPTGPTTATNLVCLCRRHHRMKQQGRWRPHLDPGGTLTWTNPTTGRTRVTEPHHRTLPELVSVGPPPF